MAFELAALNNAAGGQDAGPGADEAPGSGTVNPGPGQIIPPAGSVVGMGGSPTAQAAANPPAPMVAKPGTPHAGLLNMLGGLFLGMDAFARAAATGGREGGAREVLEAQANAANLKLKQDAAQREARESEARIQHTQALTNSTIAQTQILQHDAPLNYQRLVLGNQKMLADFLINDLHIQPAFAVPLIQGQTTDQHISAVNTKANGDLINNTVVPVHDSEFGGNGTSYGFNFDQLRKVNLSQEQAAPTLANIQNQIDLARSLLGDKDPAVQVAQGRLDIMKKAPSVNGWDFYNFNQQTQAVLMSKVSNQQTITDVRQKQLTAARTAQEVEAGARPKNLDDAQSRATAAQLAFQKNPTPETKQALADANAQLQGFRRLEIGKAYDEAVARVQAQRQADQQDLKLVAAELVKPDNLTALKDVASMRGDQRLRLYAEAKKIDPSFDPGMVNNKIHFVEQFTNPNGKQQQNIAAYNTFMLHAADAADAIDSARNTNLPFINTPINQIKKQFGDAEYQKFVAAISPVASEYVNFLKAGFAPSVEDVKEGKDLLNTSMTPAQLEASLKQMGHTALRRAYSINQEYKTVMGGNYPNLITPEARDAAEKLGLGEGVASFTSGGQLGKPNSGTTGRKGQEAFDPTKDFHPIKKAGQ